MTTMDRYKRKKGNPLKLQIFDTTLEIYILRIRFKPKM